MRIPTQLFRGLLKDLPHLGFERPIISHGSFFQAVYHSIIEVANDNLRYLRPPDITFISRSTDLEMGRFPL